jgi:hypothetical protein
MRPALLVASAVAGLALAVPASATSNSDYALLSVPKLGWYSRVVWYGDAGLSKGPSWDPSVSARPGQGQIMVIMGHDVTRIPGYGIGGPFYNLVTLRKGDVAMIRWHGKTYHYRAPGGPTWRVEGPTKLSSPVEAVWFYSCWPRHTHNGRFWEELRLYAVTL